MVAEGLELGNGPHRILIPRGGHRPWRSYQVSRTQRCADCRFPQVACERQGRRDGFLLRGRPMSATSQALDLHSRKNGIIPFDARVIQASDNLRTDALAWADKAWDQPSLAR